MIKALTLETFLSLAAVSLHTIADDQISCQTRIESNLLNSWERQLYDYYPEMFVSIVRCDQNFYDFFIGAMHEGLHALDTDLKAAQEMMLQIESGNLEYDPSFIENNIKIHTQSGYDLFT